MIGIYYPKIKTTNLLESFLMNDNIIYTRKQCPKSGIIYIQKSPGIFYLFLLSIELIKLVSESVH